jgi:hypothetical protein
VFTKHSYWAISDWSKFIKWANIESVIKEGYSRWWKRFIETSSDGIASIKIEVEMGRIIGTSRSYNLEYTKLRTIIDYDWNVISSYPIGDFSIN